jgi:3-hydroxyisobutyrate dehydrogenase
MKVGFIGLGAMGLPMAANLARAGLLAGAWNRSSSRAEALATDTGVKAYPDPESLAADCDMVILCVSADADVIELAARIAPVLRPGAIVADCSTVSSATAQQAAATVAGAGGAFLDCPVSGGVEGARNATLAIMCGGDAEAFERARPVLERLGRTVAHIGPTGTGQATKATNQIMCAGIIQAIGEAMAFADAEGLPLEKVIEVLGQGAGSSWYFVNRAPFMARGEYPAGFRVRLHYKDLEICREMAVRRGGALPVVETTLLHYRRLIAEGFGDEDISSIHRLTSSMFRDGNGNGED